MFKLLIVLYFFSFHLSFAENAHIKIGFIDISKIENNSLAISDLKKKMSQKEDEIKGTLLESKKSIETRYQDLQSKQAVFSRDVIEQRAKEIENDYILLQQQEKLSVQAMEIAKMQTLSAIQDEIKVISKNLDSDYDIILTNQSVIYVSKNIIDLTESVLAKLNKTIKEVEFFKLFDQIKKEGESKMGIKSIATKKSSKK